MGVNAGRHVSLAINVADVLNFSRACIEILGNKCCMCTVLHPSRSDVTSDDDVMHACDGVRWKMTRQEWIVRDGAIVCRTRRHVACRPMKTVEP